jgi:hypothetical protein
MAEFGPAIHSRIRLHIKVFFIALNEGATWHDARIVQNSGSARADARLASHKVFNI